MHLTNPGIPNFIHPTGGESVGRALNELRKESLDVYNRLHSIEEDISFVNEVHKAYPGFPILPNLRCGAWYTDPQIATDLPAYFKSTDGHYNNWSFNLRRPNLHLLALLEQSSGMIIVDSTRSGKRIPDALSKTLPIWCAVVNRAISGRYEIEAEAGNENEGEHAKWDRALYTPPTAVSAQEHDQIEKRLNQWAENLMQSSFHLPLLDRPLRPFWITPTVSTFPDVSSARYIPIVCVSASQAITEGAERRTSGFTYIQGSGDDHELWGMGLSPSLFWSNKSQLLATARSELPSLIASLVSQPPSGPPTASQSDTPIDPTISSKTVSHKRPSPIAKVHGRVLITALSDGSTVSGETPHALIVLEPHLSGAAGTPGDGLLQPSTTQVSPIDRIIDFSSNKNLDRDPPSLPPDKLTLRYIPGKKGSTHFLRAILPQSISFAHQQLLRGRSVCVACPDGKEISVCVVLTILQKWFDDNGEFIGEEENARSDKATKVVIRTRLEWIIQSHPSANPSRMLLKRVNNFFLGYSI